MDLNLAIYWIEFLLKLISQTRAILPMWDPKTSRLKTSLKLISQFLISVEYFKLWKCFFKGTNSIQTYSLNVVIHWNIYIFRVFVCVMVVLSIIWIPVIANMQGGQLYIYIQAIAAYLSPPIAAVYLIAVLWKRGNEQVRKLIWMMCNITTEIK